MKEKRIWYYWERVTFLKEHGFAYDAERKAYVDAAGWELSGYEIYDTLDTMTYEVFCEYVKKRPVRGS